MSTYAQYQTSASTNNLSVNSHGVNWLTYFSLLKLGPRAHWFLIQTISCLAQRNTNQWKQLTSASRKEGIEHCPNVKISKATANLFANPSIQSCISVVSTDVCETPTFITSTCRSSLREGVTLTAFSIWLSNCFSSESVSTDTNLSSESSFCREKMSMYRLKKTAQFCHRVLHLNLSDVCYYSGWVFYVPISKWSNNIKYYLRHDEGTVNIFWISFHFSIIFPHLNSPVSKIKQISVTDARDHKLLQVMPSPKPFKVLEAGRGWKSHTPPLKPKTTTTKNPLHSG